MHKMCDYLEQLYSMQYNERVRFVYEAHIPCGGI
jgi:hypothetical protein